MGGSHDFKYVSSNGCKIKQTQTNVGEQIQILKSLFPMSWEEIKPIEDT